MEPDRVEMSVGVGMVNGDHIVNGVATNGGSIDAKSHSDLSSAGQGSNNGVSLHTNGQAGTVKKEVDGGKMDTGSILHDAAPELLQALSSEFYLPMARLVSRSAQSCWNDLVDLVERLASAPALTSNTQHGGATINDQSRVNLDKKDSLLNFARSHKDKFIKLLVLLQWSKRSEDVRKTIELNLWIQQRRQAFNNATGLFAAMMRGLADSQVPNPDLHTAMEVLATGNVSSMPKLDYMPQPSLTAKQMLRLLRRLNMILCTRMTLAEDIEPKLRNYRVHDGRVTFVIENEFSFDVSVVSENKDAKFGMVDFDFLFTPSPSIPDGLRDQVTFISNAALDKDGFAGVYSFLHDLALSYKLNEFARQARELSRGLWAGRLRVEVLRRTLVVQYWLNNPGPKNWLEIGIHSGRSDKHLDKSAAVADIQLRWMREGKHVDNHEITIDSSKLSIEHILRQVVAQHTNYLFDAMYDKLATTAPYLDGDLDISQCSSPENTADCVLEVQLSKADALQVMMEPVGGSLVLSPVNERTSRLQFDLARSTNMVDDFVARVPGLRSNTAVSNLSRSLANSQWQRLEGLKISLVESEKLFGKGNSRATFIRLQQWTQFWMLAVTQSNTGDRWWLMQLQQPNNVSNCHVTEIVKGCPLFSKGLLSSVYLECFAAYATATIALQCNIEYLSKNNFVSKLSEIAAYDGNTRLPALQFARPSRLLPASSSGRAHQPSGAPSKKASLSSDSFISLRCHSFAIASRKVVMVAKAALVAEPAVLVKLAGSKLDQCVAIIPDKQEVMIKMESDAGTPVIEELTSKLSHLENIVACAASVNKSTEHKLQSLSLSTITILYNAAQNLSLAINFGKNPDDLSATFLPTESNPQQCLSPWVAQRMKLPGHKSSRNLSTIFVVLKMTEALMAYLHKIQSIEDVTTDIPSAQNQLRVHVLCRSPRAFGLQYFSHSSNFAHDQSGMETPKKLLARFEIISMKRGQRLMWMVRPAIEEFNSYIRPSFTSKALRDELNKAVFKHQSPLWLALDGGAACPYDKPEGMLSAIHRTIQTWAKDAVKPEATTRLDADSVSSVKVDNAVEKKPTKPNMPTPQRNPSNSNTQQRPNGIQRPQQTSGQRSQQFNKNHRTQPSKPMEVISID